MNEIKLKDINWNQMYYFYEVAKYLSMKDAAKALGITQPTVSDQIAKLEKSLDLKLFKRLPRKLSFTEEGAFLYIKAKDIFDAGRKLLDSITPTILGGYSVKVGIIDSKIMFSAINFVSRYWDIFAPFGVVNTFRSTLESDLIKAILTGDYDWGITSSKPQNKRIECQKFKDNELLFCCSKELIKKFKSKKDIIRNIPFAQTNLDKDINELIFNCLERENSLPKEIINSDHFELILELTKRGRCVSVVDEHTYNNLSVNDMVSFRLSKKLSLSYYAIWLKGTEKMIAIKKLLDLISNKQTKKTNDDKLLQLKVSDVSPTMLVSENI